MDLWTDQLGVLHEQLPQGKDGVKYPKYGER
jgi:hypothetical protein